MPTIFRSKPVQADNFPEPIKDAFRGNLYHHTLTVILVLSKYLARKKVMFSLSMKERKIYPYLNFYLGQQCILLQIQGLVDWKVPYDPKKLSLEVDHIN